MSNIFQYLVNIVPFLAHFTALAWHQYRETKLLLSMSRFYCERAIQSPDQFPIFISHKHSYNLTHNVQRC